MIPLSLITITLLALLVWLNLVKRDNKVLAWSCLLFALFIVYLLVIAVGELSYVY